MLEALFAIASASVGIHVDVEAVSQGFDGDDVPDFSAAGSGALNESCEEVDLIFGVGQFLVAGIPAGVHIEAAIVREAAHLDLHSPEAAGGIDDDVIAFVVDERLGDTEAAPGGFEGKLQLGDGSAMPGVVSTSGRAGLIDAVLATRRSLHFSLFLSFYWRSASNLVQKHEWRRAEGACAMIFATYIQDIKLGRAVGTLRTKLYCPWNEGVRWSGSTFGGLTRNFLGKKGCAKVRSWLQAHVRHLHSYLHVNKARIQANQSFPTRTRRGLVFPPPLSSRSAAIDLCLSVCA